MTKESKENKEQEQALEQAFESVYTIIKSGRAFLKNKNDYYAESCLYALKILKAYGRVNSIKKLLIDSRLVFLKTYFESVGLFFQYKASEDFLKVIKDSDGLFEKTESVESLPTYTDFLKEQKEKKEPPKVDYNKRLASLFKGMTKSQVESTFKDFLKTIKN